MDTKALRQKILDLAIRGKLVPQDPSDEPASVLLERIREQKKQMVKEGKLKAKDIKNDTIIFVGEDNLHYEKFADGTVKCIEEEIPFEVPEGWEWARLGTISNIVTGRLDANAQTPDGEYPFFTCGEEVFKTNSFAFDCNAILLGGNNATGDFKMHRFSGKFNAYQRVYVITTFPEIDADYLYSHIQYYLPKLQLQSIGSQTRYLKLGMITELLIALPALDEQKCISESCNKYLNYCTEIACEKDSLKDIIKNAKSKILDLAIRGKLVPQDPNDEPASVLLERIRTEKEELIKQGKIKRDKKESVIFKGDDNSYYGIHLPDGWNWASLREIALSISDGSHNPPPDNGSGIPLLSAANINDNSILMNEISRWITNEKWEIENQRTNIEVGDVLLTIVGSIGRSAVVQNDNHFALQRSVAVIKPCLINPLYLMHIVQSPQIQKWLTDNSKGTAQKGIYLNALSLMIIPIPPLAEQARIVEQIYIAYKQLDLISNALL